MYIGKDIFKPFGFCRIKGAGIGNSFDPFLKILYEIQGDFREIQRINELGL